MTRRANLFFLFVALILALITSVVVMKELTRWRTAHAAKTASIVVVVKGVGAHQVVPADAVALRSIPISALESGSVQSLAEVVGHFTATAWFAGQQVVAPMVLSDYQKAAFPLSIPAGERAFTIANDPVTGVDHLISKGDRVDVLVTYSDKQENGPIVSTLLQNIEVLYVDNPPALQQTSSAVASSQSGTTSSSGAGGQGSSPVDTLTLAVTPKQAEALQFASSFGRIHIVLRRPSNSSSSSPPSPIAPVGPGGQSLSSP